MQFSKDYDNDDDNDQMIVSYL